MKKLEIPYPTATAVASAPKYPQQREPLILDPL